MNVLLLALITLFSMSSFAQFSKEEDDRLKADLIKWGRIKIEPSDSCGEIDLNKDANSPFRRIPVYDQDGAGLCYAYTAAQMTDYYLIKNGVRNHDLTNPVYASWAAYYKNSTLGLSSNLSSGQTDTVIEGLRKVGVCSDREVKARLSVLKANGSVTDAELVTFLEASYEHKSFFAQNWQRTLRDVERSTTISCVDQETMKQRLERYGLFAASPLRVVNEVLDQCKRRSIQLPELKVIDSGGNEPIANAVEQSLARGLPAEFGVCGRALEDGSFQGLKSTNPLIAVRFSRANVKEECGGHSVLITGRAMINGSCQYMVRNSWGADWYSDASLACACITHSGQYKQICAKPEAKEVVGCWLNKEHLLNNSGGATVFK